MSEELIENIRLKAAEHGIDTFGTCSLAEVKSSYPEHIGNLADGFRSALVFGIPLPSACLDNVIDKPTPIYMHHYRQLNYILDRFTMQAAIMIEMAGAKALAIPASQIISWKPIPRGHISHKMLAAAAGLGWRGRNNLLVTMHHGSQLRLASILTDLPLKQSNSPENLNCGTCRSCITSCPASAIKENPEDFDVMACSQKLAEFQNIPLIGQRICGVCVKACKPKNNI